MPYCDKCKNLADYLLANGVIVPPDETVIVESVFECDEYNCRGAECLYVDENTISEFTSLTDKNGKKIFEGDIVRCYFADGYEEKGVIKWSDEDVRFAFVPLDEEYRWGIDNTDKFEVIGSIHDNPELLKGE